VRQDCSTSTGRRGRAPQVYQAFPRPDWWPLPEWNADQTNKGRATVLRVYNVLRDLRARGGA
jgi:hypothetical protein